MRKPSISGFRQEKILGFLLGLLLGLLLGFLLGLSQKY